MTPQVANVDAPAAAAAALCRAVAYPRLALKCAALREALAFMGHCGPEGEEVSPRGLVGPGWLASRSLHCMPGGRGGVWGSATNPRAPHY